MKTGMKSHSLIILLLLIAANCIARSIKYKFNSKERFNPLIRRNQPNNPSCEMTISLFQMCLGVIEGAVVYNGSFITDCDVGFAFYINTNAFHINHTGDFYQYNGIIVTTCWPFEENMYNITGNMYLNDGKLNGTLNVCGDPCTNMSFQGEYEAVFNSSCSDVMLEAKVCQQ